MIICVFLCFNELILAQKLEIIKKIENGVSGLVIIREYDAASSKIYVSFSQEES